MKTSATRTSPAPRPLRPARALSALGATLLAVAAALGAVPLVAAGAAAADAPVVPLPREVRAALEPLGKGIVGEALPAPPIDEPSRLRNLEPGTWRYEVLAGADRGHVQTVRVERVANDGPDAAWRVLSGSGEIQQLRVTTEHEVVKLSQTDLQSDRIVVYRPGLVLDPGMRVGQSKTVKRRLSTHKAKRPDEVEYDGELDYTVGYIGMYRVTTPAGRFDARLLEHDYSMKIGPATATHHSYGFYADGVGNVADVSEESVKALLVYRRSSSAARILLSAPED